MPQVGANQERLVTVASAPFPAGTGTPDAGDAELDTGIRQVLLKLRNDLSANAVKQAVEVSSLRAPLQLWLGPKEAPELAALQPGEVAQTGYFQGGGLALRPLLGIFRVRPPGSVVLHSCVHPVLTPRVAQFPVILIFAAGRGMATAKALLECTTTGGLTLRSREDVRLYVSASVDAELPFADQYAAWEAQRGVRVRPGVLTPAAGSPYTTGGVREAFDADDLVYDPDLTGAVVLGDEAFEKEVLELLEDAGVPKEHTVLGSVDAPLTEYMRSVKFAAAEE